MIEKDRAMFMVFIDLDKVCDNACTEKLWRVLFDYGVRGRLLRSVRALYEGGRSRVKVQGMESQWLGCIRVRGRDTHCRLGYLMFLLTTWCKKQGWSVSGR